MIRRLIILLLIVGCEEFVDDSSTTSLEWILLVSNSIAQNDFNDYSYEVNTCEDLVLSEGKYYFSDGESRRCICLEDGTQCGDCFIEGTGVSMRVDNCDGYTLCENSNYTNSECCYLAYHNDVVNENGIQETDSDGNPLTESIYEFRSNLFYKYRLIWNKDISVCDDANCDITIPSYIPSASFTNVCEGDGMTYCEDDYYFHTYCDNIIDTTLLIKDKTIPFIKIGWFEINNNNSYNSIEYDSRNKLIITEESEWNFINGGWQVVDYQSTN